MSYNYLNTKTVITKKFTNIFIVFVFHTGVRRRIKDSELGIRLTKLENEKNRKAN